MNCETARIMSTFFGRHGEELSTEDRAEFEAHLKSCASCASRHQAEQSFDSKISQAMRSVVVPSDLKSKITDSLAADRGEWLRKRLVGLGAAAGVALLGFAGYVAYQIQTAPALRADAIMAMQDRSPEDQVASELSKHGLRYNPERPFDLTQLTMAGESELQGREVPVLYFRNIRKNSHAKVYVVNDRMLNWKALDPTQVEIHSNLGYQVSVMPDAIRGDVGYIIVYTGDSLEVFLESSSSR